MSHDLLEWSEKVTVQQTMEKKKKKIPISPKILNLVIAFGDWFQILF